MLYAVLLQTISYVQRAQLSFLLFSFNFLNTGKVKSFDLKLFERLSRLEGAGRKENGMSKIFRKEKKT